MAFYKWGMAALGVALLGGCASVSGPGYLSDGRYCFRESKKRICTSGPAPTVEQEAKAKQFLAEPDTVAIWLMRNTHLDAYGRVPIFVGPSMIETLPYTVSRVVVKPGQQVIVLNDSINGGILEATGKAGEQVFVEIAADIGLFATRYSLKRIAEDKGRRNALAIKLINDIRTISHP